MLGKYLIQTKFEYFNRVLFDFLVAMRIKDKKRNN